MSLFEFVGIAISLILGLGIANLLTSGVELIRRRREVQFHWVPLAWGVIVLWIHLEFWWSLFATRQRAQWTHGDFLLVASFVIALFASGSLVLPRGDDASTTDLGEYFVDHGKWGVALFGVVYVLAFPLNHRLFGLPYLAPVNILLVLMIAVIGGIVGSRSLRVAQYLTALAIALQLAVLSITVVPALRGM